MKYDARACKFNIDTGCVELLLRDGRKISIDCIGVEDALDVTMAQRTELDYLIKLLQFILGFFQLFHVAACDNQIGSFFGVGGGNAIADGATAAILQNSTPCAGDECSFSC